MKLIVIALIGISSLFAAEKPYVLKDYEKTPKTLGQVTRLAVRYSRDNLVSHMHNLLIAGRPSRFVGSVGHQKAQDKIIETLAAIDSENKAVVETFEIDTEAIKASYRNDLEAYLKSGVSPSSQEAVGMRLFTESMLTLLDQLKGKQGKNIIWEKKGFLQPEQVLIIGAHYDTIAQDPEKLVVSGQGNMPGADNNASGVAAALALVEVLSQVNLGKTVRVIFFDAEEIGQSGSRAYVAAHKEELEKSKLAGFVNLLMLGHDSIHQDKTNKSGNMRFYTRDPGQDEKGSVLDMRLAKLLSDVGNNVRSSVKFEPTARKDLTSSQLAFQPLEIPTLVMTHDWENDFNTSHHTKQDFAETLNFSTFHNATQFLVGTVLAWTFDMR